MNKKIIIGLTVLVILITPTCVLIIKNKINHFNWLPFKCLTFNRYIIKYDDNQYQINTSQDLRLYSLDRGYLLFNGTINYRNKMSFINRSIHFENGELTQGKTFTYRITQIERLSGDTINDDLFKTLLNEFMIGQNDFQIDIFKIDKLSYLIGGPYAFIYVCTRY